MENKKTFRSRISVLLIIFILAIFVPISILIYKAIPIFVIIIGTFLFIVFIFTGIRYVVTDEYLSFNTWGTCEYDFPISDIVSVERSYNPLSSPAGSLKRLRINFKEDAEFPYLLVSPVREREFIETLKAINPNIRVEVSDKKGWWRIWDWDI